MRDFDRGFAGDRVVVGDEQPVGEVALDDCGRDGCELVGRGAAAQVVVVVAGSDELGEQAAHTGFGVGVHVRIELFGSGRQRAADAAELGVFVRGDGGSGASFVELGECELQERERAGSAHDVARPWWRRVPVRSARRHVLRARRSRPGARQPSSA